GRRGIWQEAAASQSSADGTGGYASTACRQKTAALSSGRSRIERWYAGQGPGRRRSSATPTARLSPTELSTETGCSATVRWLEPPTRTLAPRPAAIVTSPVAPK